MKQEFKNIIESLNSVGREKAINGFSVPDGYFDELSDRVNDELGLSNIGEDLPEDYFSILENNMMDVVGQEKGRVINLPFRNWSAAVAILILGIVSFSLWTPSNTDDISQLQFVDILDEEVLDYLILEENISYDEVLDNIYREDIIESIEIEEYAIEADDPFLEELIEELTDAELEELLL